jgi:hypothetical protein
VRQWAVSRLAPSIALLFFFLKGTAMKGSLYMMLLLLLLSACNGKGEAQMKIEGTVSSQYDGQKIYLLPLPHPTPQNVDSTVIRNGHFAFSVPADSSFYDITISRKANAQTQRLLIIAEKGKLNVEVGMVSSARGTLLNDRLQHWKEAMEGAQKTESVLSHRMMLCGDDAVMANQLQTQCDSVTKAFGNTTYQFIGENINPLGCFIFMNMSSLLTEQQIDQLKASGIEQWKPKQH